MKDILILSNNNYLLFEAIIKYFTHRHDLRFRLLCDSEESKIAKSAKKHKIDTYFVQKENIETFFENRKYDLIICCDFNCILSKNIVEKNKIINIHSSLLPKYKGLNPIKKAYINHDIKTGISIHYVDEFVNNGKIIYQHELKINPKWKIEKLTSELTKLQIYYYPRVIEKLLGLNVLVYGSDACANVIVEKVLQSNLLNKIYLVNPNDGFCHLGEVINYKNYSQLAKKAKEYNINLAIFLNQESFNKDIIKAFKRENIKTLAIDENASKLETSKLFAKKILRKYQIKTAPYKKINSINDIDKFLSFFKKPIIKADGLTSGKGVYINSDISKVKNELMKFLDGKYDNASKTCLIEEKMRGFELSLFSFWDGETILHFPLCQDFKQNKTNLMTQGLASICPVEISKQENYNLEQYKLKLEEIIKKEKIKAPFVINSDLMIYDEEIQVVEFNTRLGDVSSQVLLNYIKNDWLDIFYSLANKMLNFINLIESNSQMTSIVLYSKGYPLKTRQKVEVKNIENLNNFIKIYFFNIIKEGERYFSNTGRILSAVSNNQNVLYKYLSQIDFEEKEYLSNVEVKK